MDMKNKVHKIRLITLITTVTAFLCLPVVSSANSAGMARQVSNEIADTVDQVMPSVVVVRTEAIQYYLARDYYRGNLYKIPQPLVGQGSGVIFKKQGYVLTSYHVVKNADNIEVVLDNEEKYGAKLVGADAGTDLAVLKIESGGKSDFDPIEIGDSNKLRVGEIVVAIGSPFSLQSSVTMGMVSQKGRHVGLLPYEDFIQTDASINPGNSGGPLVNVEGRMIGINAVIQTSSPQVPGNIGIGFAVPVNLAIRVGESIIENGSFARPWIGIVPQEILQDDPETQGVQIGRVIRDTPAANAGLQRNDIIIEVEKKPITSVTDLQKAIMEKETDEQITLTIKRGGKTRSVRLTAEPIPAPQRQIPNNRYRR